WTPLAYTPKASTTNDWTLYTSGQIALPEEFVNHDSVYVAFYFYAPAASSTTWELQNFLIEEGEGENNGGNTTKVMSLPYKNESLSGLSTYDKKESSAWSMGTSYTQATGYQKWNGAAEKSNKEVESYLITPFINTTCTSGKVSLSFDQTIRYENNVADWQKYHKIFVSNNYNGKTEDFDKAEWKELAYTPVASTTNDWTLYSSGDIAIPEEYVNKDSVCFAFYFYAPENASTTWELKNLIIKDSESSDIEEKTKGTKEDPLTVAAAIEDAKKLAAGATSELPYYIKGKVSRIGSIETSQYQNATFYISDDGSQNNEFEAYQVYGLGGAKITDANYVKVGDEVVLYGKITNYKGNTYETTGKGTAYIYSLNGKTEGGNTTGGDDSGNTGGSTGTSEGITFDGTTVTLANSAVTAGEETITVDLNTLSFTNQQEVVTIDLSDGTKITFDKGTNTNAPKFYEATKGIRVYANNTITFAGKKAIAKILITCDEYSGTKYVGNTTATIAFDGNNIVYTNASESAGTQLRVQTITITYAK
ncbi:MAG: hypothetical protein J6Y15_07450, partial [Bacteroidaceae bacterium]|nr:hypothetical protein [Bacteroidaceae bacterium]